MRTVHVWPTENLFPVNSAYPVTPARNPGPALQHNRHSQETKQIQT